ncbi:hypothetical protein FACS1894120_2500 [Clostridia bacterium]|nr:hypothetical protein FACS1894120_2500 [Clostridia bacterium]
MKKIFLRAFAVAAAVALSVLPDYPGVLPAGIISASAVNVGLDTVKNSFNINTTPAVFASDRTYTQQSYITVNSDIDISSAADNKITMTKPATLTVAGKGNLTVTDVSFSILGKIDFSGAADAVASALISACEFQAGAEVDFAATANPALLSALNMPGSGKVTVKVGTKTYTYEKGSFVLSTSENITAFSQITALRTKYAAELSTGNSVSVKGTVSARAVEVLFSPRNTDVYVSGAAAGFTDWALTTGLLYFNNGMYAVTPVVDDIYLGISTSITPKLYDVKLYPPTNSRDYAYDPNKGTLSAVTADVLEYQIKGTATWVKLPTKAAANSAVTTALNDDSSDVLLRFLQINAAPYTFRSTAVWVKSGVFVNAPGTGSASGGDTGGGTGGGTDTGGGSSETLTDAQALEDARRLVTGAPDYASYSDAYSESRAHAVVREWYDYWHSRYIRRLEDDGVWASLNYGVYHAPIRGTYSYTRGTEGYLRYYVRLHRGSGYRDVSFEMTIAAERYDGSDDSSSYRDRDTSSSYRDRDTTTSTTSNTVVLTGADGKKYVISREDYESGNYSIPQNVQSAVGTGIATTTKSTLASGSIVTDYRIAGKLVTRVYVKSSQQDKIDTTGDPTTTAVSGTRVKKAASVLTKYYKPTALHIISYDKQGKFPVALESAVKLPTTLGKTGLALYCYDSAKNTLTRVKNSGMKFDSAGYLHFKTEYACELIVTRGLLSKKTS